MEGNTHDQDPIISVFFQTEYLKYNQFYEREQDDLVCSFSERRAAFNGRDLQTDET